MVWSVRRAREPQYGRREEERGGTGIERGVPNAHRSPATNREQEHGPRHDRECDGAGPNVSTPGPTATPTVTKEATVTPTNTNVTITPTPFA